jgi:sortase A
VRKAPRSHASFTVPIVLVIEGPKLVLLTKKRRWPRYSKRRIYKRRRRAGLFFLVLLTVLALAGLKIYFSSGVFEGASDEPL